MDILEEAKKAEAKLRDAEADHIKKLNELFPNCSVWNCYHGSKSGYIIEVVECNRPYRIWVKNVMTGCVKQVYWKDLGH